MVDRFERFSFAIFETSKYWHRLTAEEMEKQGLKGPHSMYLLALGKHPEGLTASQICELCGRDKSDVSRMMAILEKQGFVRKEGIHQNLYKGVFKLTEKGQEAAEYVHKRVCRAVEMAGKDLTEEKRAIFYEALESIVSNLRTLSKEGIPD